MKRALTLACLTLATASAGARAGPHDVLVVDASGGGDFTDIQPAVDAADQQDTILVRGGTYGGFAIANKALSIAADDDSTPVVAGPVTIEQLPPGRDVNVSGLYLEGGFTVTDCTGSVLFVDCAFIEPGLSEQAMLADVPPGMHRVEQCDDVTFVNCVLVGRDGDTESTCGETIDAYHGEPALVSVDSTVSLYACPVQGGRGGNSYSGTTGLGGCCPAYQGDGGDGIRGEGSSFIYLDGTFPVGGQRGDHDCDGFFCSGTRCDNKNFDGEDVKLEGGSTLHTASHPRLYFEAPSVARGDESLPVLLVGPEGAHAFLLWSEDPHRRWLGESIGILHLDSHQLGFVSLGKIPAGGVLQTDVTLPPIPPGDDSLRTYFQVFALGPARVLGNPRSLLVVDPSF